MHAKTTAASALVAALILAACGGGNNSDSTSTETASPAASTPDTTASTPSTSASTPDTAASTPDTAASSASSPDTAASTPDTAASTPTPVPVPTGADATYSDKTTFTLTEMGSCPQGAASLDLDQAHGCLTGNFVGVLGNPDGSLRDGNIACTINITPPKVADAQATNIGLNFYLSYILASANHPNGEYLDNHVYLSPAAFRNQRLTGFAVTENNYARTTDTDGTQVIRLSFSGHGTNTTPLDQFEKTGDVVNAFHLTARKPTTANIWRVQMTMDDSYTPANGTTCIATVYK